jgi:transposase
MRHFELSASEVQTLQQRMRETRDLRECKRLQAILMVAEGVEISTIASLLGITVQSIYNWLNRYARHRHPHSLQEGHHTGRLPWKSTYIENLLDDLLVKKPRAYGYRFAVWTAQLIVDHLQHMHALAVSKATVRRCLRRLHYRCKRPRYVLSRCSPTWRQAKGGFKEA